MPDTTAAWVEAISWSALMLSLGVTIGQAMTMRFVDYWRKQTLRSFVLLTALKKIAFPESPHLIHGLSARTARAALAVFFEQGEDPTEAEDPTPMTKNP